MNYREQSKVLTIRFGFSHANLFFFFFEWLQSRLSVISSHMFDLFNTKSVEASMT